MDNRSFGPRDHNQVRHGDVNMSTSGAHAMAYSGGYRAGSERPYMNYPPLHNQSNPSVSRSNSGLGMNSKNEDASERYITRTPSPTPSETALLSRKGVLDMEKMLKWKFWLRKEWTWYYIILIILIVLVILISVYDRQIVHYLQPTGEKIRDLPGGWIIPIAIFFVISFPPLFGHEILAILCGVVWGLWIGFAITAAGTFLGEIGNFYAFRYCCRARGEKLERTELQYGCLARIVRDGGFKIALIARYSAIPGHFTTAVFSTCGMGIFVFALAAFLSLPKQFVTVYIGVIIEQSGSGTESSRDELISKIVLGATVVITIWAMWYIYKKMDEVKHDVVYKRRKSRQAKFDRAGRIGDSSVTVFNPAESESNLPLNPGENNAYQHWDSRGNAMGMSGNPSLRYEMPAPKPKRAQVTQLDVSNSDVGADLQTGPTSTYKPATRSQASRQESMDSVGWEAQNMGTDVYHLPSITPHTPLSGGFANSPHSTNESLRTRQIGTPLQQSTTPLPPPLAPPPSSPKTPTYKYTNPFQQPQLPYPTQAGTPQATSFPNQPSVYIPPSFTPSSAQTPSQQQTFVYPVQHMTPNQIPRQQPLIFQSNTGPPQGPPSYQYTTGQHVSAGHVPDGSGSTAYYTPPHTRASTENDHLPLYRT